MTVLSYDNIINRISNEFVLTQPIFSTQETATAAFGLNTSAIHRAAFTKALPSLPSGVTGYVASRIHVLGTVAGVEIILGKLINLGSLDISSNVFTDGAQMPSVNELGVNRQIPSAIFVEVTTALNATPGSLNVTYVDQDGNAAETSTTQTLPPSGAVGSAGYINLNSPDFGAIDITGAARTGGTTPTGVLTFWGMIPICMNPISFSNSIAPECNLLTDGFSFPIFGGGDVIGGFALGSTAVKGIMGNITFIGLD